MMRGLLTWRDSGDSGFTLVEVTTSVGLLLVVLTAAWMLLTTSGDNLNRIQFGSEASETNRTALESFGRDVGHGVVLADGASPVVIAEPRRCGIVVNADTDAAVELVTWVADDEKHELLRVVTESTPTTPAPAVAGDFAGGATTTSTVVTGLAEASAMADPMFSYMLSATAPASSVREVGLIRMRLRNGQPVSTMNVSDRTSAFRVIAFVINGY